MHFRVRVEQLQSILRILYLQRLKALSLFLNSDALEFRVQARLGISLAPKVGFVEVNLHSPDRIGERLEDLSNAKQIDSTR